MPIIFPSFFHYIIPLFLEPSMKFNNCVPIIPKLWFQIMWFIVIFRQKHNICIYAYIYMYIYIHIDAYTWISPWFWTPTSPLQDDFGEGEPPLEDIPWAPWHNGAIGTNRSGDLTCNGVKHEKNGHETAQCAKLLTYALNHLNLGNNWSPTKRKGSKKQYL